MFCFVVSLLHVASGRVVLVFCDCNSFRTQAKYFMVCTKTRLQTTKQILVLLRIVYSYLCMQFVTYLRTLEASYKDSISWQNMISFAKSYVKLDCTLNALHEIMNVNNNCFLLNPVNIKICTNKNFSSNLLSSGILNFLCNNVKSFS